MARDSTKSQRWGARRLGFSGFRTEPRPLTEPEAWRVALERGPQSCLFHAVNQLLWLLLAEAGHPEIVVVVVVFVVTMPLIIEHVPCF